MVVASTVKKLADGNHNDIVKKIIHLEAAIPADVYHEVEGEPLDYFDGSFRSNFIVVPVIVNSWSQQDEILKNAFNLVIPVLGLDTPDYKTQSMFGPPIVKRKSDSKAMGYRSAAHDFPAGLLWSPMAFSDWSVGQKQNHKSKNKHPYLIRDHGSMISEYYLDVAPFFERFLDKILGEVE